MNKIDNYLNEVYIQEDIKEALSAYQTIDKRFLSKMKGTIKENDPKGSMKRLKKIVPSGFNAKTALSKVDAALGMKVSEYPKLKKRATVVVKNSINGISNQMAEIAGTFLAFHSLFAKKGQENTPVDKNLQLNLKIFVTKVRKFGDDYEESDSKEKSKMRPSDYSDISVAWVIIVMSTALAFGIGAGIYVALKVVALAFAATLPFLMSALTYTICGVIIIAAFIFIAGQLA